METLTIEVLNRCIPDKILQTSFQMNNDFPLLANKKNNRRTPYLYVFTIQLLPTNKYHKLVIGVLNQNNIFA